MEDERLTTIKALRVATPGWVSSDLIRSYQPLHIVGIRSDQIVAILQSMHESGREYRDWTLLSSMVHRIPDGYPIAIALSDDTDAVHVRMLLE